MPAPEPDFTTIAAHGDFQVRDYPSLTVAEVVVPGGQWRAANRGFRLLAGYIFGANARDQKLAMTAPVVQQRLQAAWRTKGEDWIVRFIMPADFDTHSLPPPNDPRVRLRVMPPTRYALVGFSGWALPFLVRSETARLRTWMRARGLTETGPLQLAQYDPPWTLWFVRRNEILAPVRD